MKFLLVLSQQIDRFNTRLAKAISWLVLLVVLVSAGNAAVRKMFNLSSNGLLEIQWYLFSAIFLLTGGYTLLMNEHVRIDLLSSRLSRRTQAKVDIVCTVLFLFPFCYMMLLYGWPMFSEFWYSGETSSDAGGLVRWPVIAFIPLGFFLLFSQGVSEIIKRVAFLTGQGPDPAGRHPEMHGEVAP